MDWKCAVRAATMNMAQDSVGNEMRNVAIVPSGDATLHQPVDTGRPLL